MFTVVFFSTRIIILLHMMLCGCKRCSRCNWEFLLSFSSLQLWIVGNWVYGSKQPWGPTDGRWINEEDAGNRPVLVLMSWNVISTLCERSCRLTVFWFFVLQVRAIDPVNQVSYASFLKEKLMACASLHGEAAFQQAMSRVPSSILSQLQSIPWPWVKVLSVPEFRFVQ